MSLIVSVKINDGVVMAADSATTFFKPNGEAGQIYENANKIVNLVKGLPIGVMTCGSGGVANASIDTLLKDLRVRLSVGGDLALDPATYTMEQATTHVKEFFDERAKLVDFKDDLVLRVCGYSAGRPLSEVWHVGFGNGQCFGPTSIQKEDGMGLRWNGESEALDRLVLGFTTALPSILVKKGVINTEQIAEVEQTLWHETYEGLIMYAAPIQDAIELARFMVEVTAGFMRFSIARPKTVGGLIEIAAITKHEGFKWVKRKHFYPYELNRSQQ